MYVRFVECWPLKKVCKLSFYNIFLAIRYERLNDREETQAFYLQSRSYNDYKIKINCSIMINIWNLIDQVINMDSEAIVLVQF